MGYSHTVYKSCQSSHSTTSSPLGSHTSNTNPSKPFISTYHVLSNTLSKTLLLFILLFLHSSISACLEPPSFSSHAIAPPHPGRSTVTSATYHASHRSRYSGTSDPFLSTESSGGTCDDLQQDSSSHITNKQTEQGSTCTPDIHANRSQRELPLIRNHASSSVNDYQTSTNTMSTKYLVPQPTAEIRPLSANFNPLAFSFDFNDILLSLDDVKDLKGAVIGMLCLNSALVQTCKLTIFRKPWSPRFCRRRLPLSSAFSLSFSHPHPPS